MKREDAEDKATLSLQIAARIKPMLAGLGPEIQGAILAELMSVWLSGHAPEIRKETWEAHADCMWDLVKENEFGHATWDRGLQ